jgi:autotransporter translocation and assembly factor TamB
VAGGEAALSFSGSLPDLGKDPVTLRARARLSRDRQGAELGELAFGWPGVRWALVRPAAVIFEPARVDRLELADGPHRLALSGGLGEKEALDARLELTRLDLARLPRGLLPADHGLRGERSLDARFSGTTRRPAAAAHLSIASAEVRGITGLQLLGEVAWDGQARRLTADLGLLRSAGGSLDLAADLPLPLARAKGREPLALMVDAAGWPLEVLRQVAGLEAPATGTLDAHLALAGTVAEPTAAASLTLGDARLEDLGPLGAAAALEADLGLELRPPLLAGV